MRHLILAVGLVGLVGLVACSPTATPAPTRQAEPAQEIRVTRDLEMGPGPCRPAEVGALLSRFLTGYSSGDKDAADLFASDMEWFSLTQWTRSTGKKHFVTSDQAGLRSYIERRAQYNDRMDLLEVDVFFDAARDLGHIAYTINRFADDLEPANPPGTTVIGKGAVRCDTGKLLLLSMSHDVRFQEAPELCRGNADWPDVALACSRGR